MEEDWQDDVRERLMVLRDLREESEGRKRSGLYRSSRRFLLVYELHATHI